MTHVTWDGVRELKCYGPSNEQFTAWAEFADGRRETFDGSGPECNTWACEQRRNGATRNGITAR